MEVVTYASSVHTQQRRAVISYWLLSDKIDTLARTIICKKKNTRALSHTPETQNLMLDRPWYIRTLAQHSLRACGGSHPTAGESMRSGFNP